MLDSQTTLILAAALLLVTPMVVWLILPRQDHHAKEMWCLGSWMAGAGLVLIGLRPVLPVAVSFHVANTLILGFFVCNAQSFRIMLGCAWTARGWWLRMAACFLLFSVLHSLVSAPTRGALLSWVIAALAGYVALLAWRLRRRAGSLNAWGIAAAQVVLGLAFVVHSALLLQRVVDPGPFSQSWNASPIALGAAVLTAVSTWCYVGMALELAAQERLRAQQAQQASQQTEFLGHQLTHLDRRGRMAIVSGSLAHELNQPLTAATMNAQLAQRLWAMEPVVSPMLLQLLDQIETGVDRTVRILQRIRQGQEGVAQHHERVDLQALLARALQQMAPDMARAGVRVMRQWTSQAVWCMGDELELSQVVINLLRNAVQAMAGQPEPARQLWVHCTVAQGQAQLVVRDMGHGMSPQQIEQWGQPFESTRSDGMGLGLAISRAIVHRHQGQLTLANVPQGGLQATLSMPLVEVRA